MSNSKFQRNRSEMELILGAGERFCRSDQRMTLLYRLHRLPPRRISKSKISDDDTVFSDQDFVLNLTMGDVFILSQDENGVPVHRPGYGCYFGGFGSTVDQSENGDKAKDDGDVENDVDVLPLATAIRNQDDEDEEDDDDDVEFLSFPTTFRDLDDDDEQDKVYKKQLLVGDCFSKFVDTTQHCQVGRDKSGLWVKDLGSEHGTFVNGIKLDVNVCHALKSEDLISLGFIYEEDKPWMLEIGHYWIFKVFEMPESEFQHRKKVATEAMGTSVILDSILSNIDFRDVKRYRSVSKVWDEVAKRKLRTKARVVFPLYDPKMDNVRHGSSFWGDRWLEEAQNRLSAVQNIGIQSISFNKECGTLDYPTERLVFLQNILTNNQITSVELDLLVESEDLISLLKTILACPQLSEVTFNSSLFEEFHQFESNESVTKLIFKKSQWDFLQILGLFPNAREIEFPHMSIAENFLKKKYQEELERVKVLKISDKAKWINYISSSDDSDDGYENANQSICTLTPLICSLPKSLQLVRLEITDLEVGSDGCRNLVEKFKNSLQYLKLGLCFSRSSNADVKFPEMKMLSVFKLKIQKTWDSRFPSFVSGFGSELFPRLKMLEVVIDKGNKELVARLINRNIGSAAEFQNGALRQLRFVFPSHKMKDQYSTLAEMNFRQMFPNCVNFDFDFVRQNNETLFGF